jgi:hypothetical protein
MAVLTAKGISSLAIALLSRKLVLPMTASRIPGGEFAGSNGDTITVRVPQPGAARTQATPGATITYDDVSEVAVDVAMTHLYHAKRVSDEEMSMDIEDFGRQVTRTQVDAVATGAEDLIATALAAVPASVTLALTATAADTRAGVLSAREALASADIPADGRWWFAAAPSIITRLLSVEDFVRYDASGSTSALRNATVGRIFGMNVVESNALAADTAYAYHESGLAFANRVPVRPRGAADSATASKDGVGLRHIFQYDPDVLSDATVVSTFAGSSAVADAASPTVAADWPRVVAIDVSST